MIFRSPFTAHGRGGPPALWSAPVAGEIKTISYAAGTHPNGSQGGAVLSEISTAHQTWNPEAPGTGPWGHGGYGFHTIHAFGGMVFNTDRREFKNTGAGHSAICIPTDWTFGLDDLTFKWLSPALPSDGYRAAITAAVGGTGTYAWFAAAYPLEEDVTDWQLSRLWGDWNGDYTGWPAGFGLPGRRQPEAGHSYNSNIHVPAAIMGNSGGAMFKFSKCGGQTAGVGVYGTHWLDCDTDYWYRTANLPVRSGGTPILDEQSAMIIRNYDTTGAASHTLSEWQLFDPVTKTHGATRLSTNSPGQATTGSTSIVLDKPSRLMLIFTTSDDANNNYSATPTKQRLYGASFDAALAGDFPWSEITLTNPSGSWPTVAGTTTSWQQFVWVFCPLDGCYYTINGSDGSNKVWKVSPPVGADRSSQAQMLAGSWTVSEITMTAGAFYAKAALGAGTQCSVYSRQQWDPVKECFLWLSEDAGGPVQAFNPLI